MEITFSPDERWDDDRHSIIVNAKVDGRPVTCVIPYEFITAPEVKIPDGDAAIRLFTEQRNDIEKTLRERIEQGHFTSPGEINLKPNVGYV